MLSFGHTQRTNGAPRDKSVQISYHSRMNALCPAVDRPVAGLGPEQQEPTLTLARGPSVIGTCSPSPVGEAAKLLSQRAYYSNLEERGRSGESKAFTVMLLVIRDL